MQEEGYLQEKWEIRLMLQENARRVTKEDDRKVSEELLDELMKNSRMLQCSSNYDILSQPSTLTIHYTRRKTVSGISMNIELPCSYDWNPDV